MKDATSKKHQLNNIEQVVKLAVKHKGMWFRGHSEISEELTPRIFRKEYSDIHGEEVEFFFTEEFRRRAPTISTELPKRKDYLSWLVLMQHYECPTRLLDWTENILIALFFVVSDKTGHDGELWAMDPYELNKVHESDNLYGIATIDNKYVEYLAEQPIYRFEDRFQNKLKEKYDMHPPKYPVAFQSPMAFERMNSQSSAFTIHPRPQNGCTIPKKMDDADLIRYIIPSKNKKKMKEVLYLLGIRRQTVFQDLESLSQDLKYDASLRYTKELPNNKPSNFVPYL